MITADHDSDCGCNECSLRRLVAELLAEVKRLRHDLALANDIRRREAAQGKLKA